MRVGAPLAALRLVGLGCLFALSTSPCVAAPVAVGEVLRPGGRVVGELAGGETRELVLEAPPGRVLLLSVEQLGVDVESTLSGPGSDGAAVHGVTFDTPFDRRNRESIVVEAVRHRLVLRGRETGAPAGRFAVRLEEVPGGERSVRLPLLRAESEAARHYARSGASSADSTDGAAGGPEHRRAALELYRFAADGWAEEGSAPDAARTLYAVAVLHRLLDETEAAREAAEDVAGRWRRLGEPVFEAYAWNEVGLSRWLLGRTGEAREAFGRALELSDGRDPFVAGAAAGNLCLLDFVAGDLRAGLACYEAPPDSARPGALARLRAAGARSLTGDAETSTGRAYDVLGEPERARRRYAEALESLRAAGNDEGVARVLVNLGALHRELGETDEALDAYDRALATFERLGDLRWRARTLNNLGFTYLELGEAERGGELLGRALDLWREVGDPRGEATTLNNQARAARDAGDLTRAHALQLRALERFEAAGDRSGVAHARSQLGALRTRLGDPAGARQVLESAVAAFREIGDPAAESLALRRLAAVDGGAGRPEAARALLLRALELAEGAGHRAGTAETLTALARAERALGRPAQARARVAGAAETLDALRVRIASPDLRTSHGALRHETYELWIDLLMEAHDGEPGAGWDRRALEVVERVRARTLSELLHEAGVEAARGVPPELLERRRDLERRLQAKVERSLRGGPGAGRDLLAAESAELLRELDAVEARIRRASPALAALTRPEPVDAEGLRALLDDDSLLLVYALGDARSFVWAVTRQRIESHVLPPRREIDGAVRDLHRRLADPDPADRYGEGRAAEALSRTLLGPVAGALTERGREREGRRLVVVADGALHYLPFASLPDPAARPDSASPGARPALILERRDVVSLPSVSALRASRRATAGRPRPAGRVVVVADPVFGPDDPRVLRARPASRGAGGASGGTTFVRLPASRREARAVAALAPAGESKVVLDFEARRESVLDGGLEGYGVVHFATHAVIDEDEPALSGLALSRVDPVGRPRDGFVGLREIYDLRLDADLVVLSACRGALGSEVRGEGMVGFTRGFLHAGARRVLASLWKVEDGAAAELVTRFYRALWNDGLSAPAALRRAQRELRAERRYRDPAHWAGFVLVGDWR